MRGGRKRLGMSVCGLRAPFVLWACAWQQGLLTEWVELWFAAAVVSWQLNARGPSAAVARVG
jgi:hypothetical protein